MSNANVTRNSVKQLAEQIEVLAKEVQNRLNNSGDVYTAAAELARNNSTLTFVLGELYGLQQAGTKKTVKATAVSNPNKTTNWHNVRDNLGRFAKKV